MYTYIFLKAAICAEELMGKGCWKMADKRYLVKFKASTGMGSQVFVAETPEIQDDHIVLLNSDRNLVALLMFEVVEMWFEPDLRIVLSDV
jgi:hypothetical protein